MAIDTNQINRILGAARARDPHKVQELWIDLQSVDTELSQLKTFMNVAAEVATRGDKDKAADLLLLLKDDLSKQGREDDLFDVLRQAVIYSGRVRGIREELAAQYARKYAGRPGIEAILSRTDLAGEGRIQDAVRQLDEAFYFAEGEYVFHGRGWGIGKVVEANPATGDFVIDFSRRRGQRMDAGMALKSLERRSEDDLDVLLWTEPDRVRELAKTDPIGLLKSALVSAGGKLQSRDLKSKLADVLEKSLWTKFWNKARKLAKDDPQIEMAATARSPIVLRDNPLSRGEEIAYQISRCVDFKAKMTIARRELASLRGERPVEEPSWVRAALADLGKGRIKSGNTPVAIQSSYLELAFFKSDVHGMWPDAVPEVTVPEAVDPETGEPLLDPETGEPLKAPSPPHIVEAAEKLDNDEFAEALHYFAVPDYRRRALAYAAQKAEGAADTLEAVLLNPAPQLFIEAAKVLKSIGREDVILQAVTRLLVTPVEFPNAVTAFARARLNGRLDILPERTSAEILIKTIHVLDVMSLRLKAATGRKEKARLKVIVDNLRGVLGDKGQRVIGAVIDDSTEGDVRRILQLVRQSPTLTTTLKRATEKFVIVRFPEVLANLSTGKDEGPPPLYSTAEGKRRQEDRLAEIMEVKMPQISIEIGKALDFGDISENAELDAAREKQHRLAEQATRMTDQLERVTVIDPSTVQTDEVRFGCRVVARNDDTNTDETYSILGPWDLQDDDESIISHLSHLAVGLIGHKVGEEVTVSLPGNRTANYTIKSIERAVVHADA